MKEIGSWMKVNGEFIYSSERCLFGEGMIGLTTAKGEIIYFHVLRWPGTEAMVACVKNKVLSAHIIATRQEVDVVQREDRVSLRNLSSKAPDSYDGVILVELEGKPDASPRDRLVP